jgi:hypothetical protein
MPNNEYIWYCKRRSCGAILLKTNRPYLPDGGSIKCYHCNELWTFNKLFAANTHNLRKALLEK